MTERHRFSGPQKPIGIGAVRAAVIFKGGERPSQAPETKISSKPVEPPRRRETEDDS